MKKHRFTVKNGKLVLDDRQALLMDAYKFEGKRGYITLSKERKSRSNRQNAYFWGVVLPLISDVTGYTPEEAKSAIQLLFLRVRRDGLPDTVKATSSLSKAEFEEFMVDVRQWASIELSCYIPLPNEVEFQ